MQIRRAAGRKPAAMAIPILLLLLMACGGGGGGNSSATPQPLTERLAIDGHIDWTALDAVQTQPLVFRDLNQPEQQIKSTQLRWALTNDDRHLYAALAWTDDTYDHTYDPASGPLDFDGVVLLFDNNGDGVHQPGEDKRTLVAASVGSWYVDGHVAAPAEEDTDRIGDGMARLRYDAGLGQYQAEFMIPLADDAAGQDGGLTAQTRYSLVLYDHMRLNLPAGHLATTQGAGPDSADWSDLPLATAEPHDYPELPSDLDGLIVFSADHEAANNEIYRFDPATGDVRCITCTVLPGYYKDNPSLSHDRAKVAFHASAGPADFTGFEIYTMDVDDTDGSTLRQLTNNTLLDGHPGWSPQDDRIAYASFRDGNKAHIIVMDANGTEIADLTPAGADDNDPDFLPDGRIVFKTDRFSTLPQVRMAVMNDHGSQVLQLTTGSGFSDHDPAGNTTHVLFERFNKDSDYATDPETAFTPWDILSAPADGSTAPTLLVADGWVNWLPVYSPDSRYIVYLKSLPHTAACLMTRDGKYLGRLIPDMTRIRYIDWK